MINLIPIEEKKAIRIDFYIRVLIILFLMLGFSIFAGAVAMLPTYIFSHSKASDLNKKFETQKNEIMPQVDQQAQSDINNLNNKLTLIETAIKNKYVFSEKIITEIVSQKFDGIRIEKISYRSDPLNGKLVIINGIAGSREKLLFFRRAFEGSESFKSVDLPISDFVKGSDIHFTLNLTAF